jgi:hypothetical protein
MSDRQSKSQQFTINKRGRRQEPEPEPGAWTTWVAPGKMHEAPQFLVTELVAALLMEFSRVSSSGGMAIQEARAKPSDILCLQPPPYREKCSYYSGLCLRSPALAYSAVLL